MMHSAIAHHQQTEVQPSSEQWFSLPSQLSWFIY